MKANDISQDVCVCVCAAGGTMLKSADGTQVEDASMGDSMATAGTS